MFFGLTRGGSGGGDGRGGDERPPRRSGCSNSDSEIFEGEISLQSTLGSFFGGSLALRRFGREENARISIIYPIIGTIHNLFPIIVFPSDSSMECLLDPLTEYPPSSSHYSAHLSYEPQQHHHPESQTSIRIDQV